MKQPKIKNFLTKFGRVKPTRKAETKQQLKEYDVE